MQRQDLDHLSRSLALPVTAPQLVPEPLIRREPAAFGPGLRERTAPFQRSGLAPQKLQELVQLQPLTVAACQALVTCHGLSSVEHRHLGGFELDFHSQAHQAHRHRGAAGSHPHARKAVDAMDPDLREREAALRQRPRR